MPEYQNSIQETSFSFIYPYKSNLIKSIINLPSLLITYLTASCLNLNAIEDDNNSIISFNLGGVHMSLAWIICLLLLLVVPAIMVFLGQTRKNLGVNIGAKYGYGSQLALSSAAAWAHAQALCPKRYILWGAILAVSTALLMLVALNANALSVCIYAFTLLLYELLTWGIVLCTVESGLRKYLGIKES